MKKQKKRTLALKRIFGLRLTCSKRENFAGIISVISENLRTFGNRKSREAQNLRHILPRLSRLTPSPNLKPWSKLWFVPIRYGFH